MKVQTIIIDNASRDNSSAIIRSHFFDCFLIFNETNVGFGRANNQALSVATGRYILLLNTDAFVGKETLIKTINYMDSHAECGILGVKLTGEDGMPQPSARYFPTPWNSFLVRTGMSRIFSRTRLVDSPGEIRNAVQNCDWVPGCYFLVRKAVIDEVGLFDPRYFLYYEEVDHCMAAQKAGWYIRCYYDTTVVHIGGESAKSDSAITQKGRQIAALQIESELLYYRKNFGIGGLWVGIFLNSLADLIIMSKQIVKGNGALSLKLHAEHISLLWTLFWKTRFGTLPTR